MLDIHSTDHELLYIDEYTIVWFATVFESCFTSNTWLPNWV